MDANTITIGRDNSCDIVIKDSRVSRIHANISIKNRTYVYKDMSSNGTLINGVLLNNGEMNISYGDSILLASTIVLQWVKVETLLPLGNENSLYQNFTQSEPLNTNTHEKDATGWLIAIYIFAILGGLLGICFGIMIYREKDTLPNGVKVHKYKKSHRNAALIGAILSIVSIIFWNLVALEM